MSFESEGKWHLDKRLNVSHLLTTLTVAAGIFVWGSKVETRLTVLEYQSVQHAKVQKEIKDQLIRLNDKMDRLLEK